MTRCVAWYVVAILVVCVRLPALAIEIKITDRVIDGRRVFALAGVFEVNDDAKFDAALKNVDKAMIDMDSPGGNLFAGIAIGERIGQRRYYTMVSDRKNCASACGLAWLGGTRRYVVATGRVGFHAAYVSGPEGKRETGMGNAVIGEYLGRRVRLDRSGVMCITAAPPDTLNWLTPDMARACKIPYQHVARTAEIEELGRHSASRSCDFQSWLSAKCTVGQLWCSLGLGCGR